MINVNTIKFESLKEQIQKAIELRIQQGVISDTSGFILIDGFINMPFQKELGNSFVVGGPTIPSVAVVGKSTGIVYTFALKVLIPGIQL
jgi:hypothetical protein